MINKQIHVNNIILVYLTCLFFSCHPPKPGHSATPKIFPANQLMTTIAGNGTAGYSGDGGIATQSQLSSPAGISVDALGNIYIADRVNNRIREVDAGSKVIYTVAGTGSVGYSGDGSNAKNAALNNPSGVAVDAMGNIYIADAGNNCIRKVTASTGIINTIGGTGTPGFSGDGGPATAAQLYSPIGLALDLSGNLLIADLNNNRIRKISAGSQIITTIAGGGICTSGVFCGDSSLATSAVLHAPMAVTVDASGNIYIADTGNNRVRLIKAATGIIYTIIGTGKTGFSGDGGQATAANLHNPYGVALDSYGNIYVADNFNNRIREITSGVNIISTIAGNGIGGYSGDGLVAKYSELRNPYGIVLDAAGNIYIADCNNHCVRRFN